MSFPAVDVVTQEEAKNSFLIIGIQFGMFGYVLRLGLYKQYKVMLVEKKEKKKKE